MVSTFGGLSTALSALRYQQVALDVANNNVANVNTAGYVRRRAESGAVAAPNQPSMWSRYDGHGDGVSVQSVTRMADPLLDARSRRENGSLSYLATQQTILNRVETGINEPGENGLSAALLGLSSAFQNLVSDPGGQAAREVVMEKAGAVAAAFKSQSDNVTAEIADQQGHAATAVQQVNGAAAELAQLNKTIRVAQVNKTDVGTLEDQRDQLALTLAKLVGGEVKVQPDGQYNVTVNSVALVTGDSAAQLTAAGDPLALSIGGTGVPSGVKGELGGVIDALNTTLPAYKKSLDDIATKFVAQMNTQHQAGKDSAGATGGDLFTIVDPANPAASLALAFTDASKLAASGGGALDGSNADALSRATTIGSDYTALVTSFGGTVASVNRQTSTQQALTSQVDDEREQMAGVNLDEETVNMVAAQHAYEAASKMMTVLDSILDTLINRTGVTR